MAAWVTAHRAGKLGEVGKHQRPLTEIELELEIRAAHQRARQTYGTERLHAELADNDIHATVYRVRNLRTKLGMRCKQKKKFKITTAPNQIWVSDITYIPTDEGWLYLAGHKDLFSGDLAGYVMSERMSRNLIM